MSASLPSGARLQTLAEFHAVKQAKGVVLFSSDTCSHCVLFRPVFEAVVAGHPTQPIYWVDTNLSPDIALAEEIRSIPEVRLYQNGHFVQSLENYTQSALIQLLNHAV